MDAELLARVLMRRAERSDSSSSDSDDLWDLVLEEENQRGRRELRPRIQGYMELVPQYSDVEFKSHFRLSKGSFEYVLRIIEKDLSRPMRGNPIISPRKQLLIALWKMATVDSYRSVCDRFNVGRATVVRAVRRVAHALYIRAPIFIQWPAGEHATAVMEGFRLNSGFPNIIGAIDGTHIRINAPRENPVDYINRKGYHSLQLQLVCDHRSVITHAHAGHPGSVHDERVFRQSDVSDYLESNEKFPGESHLVGDAAYELKDRLLTPFRDNGHLTQLQHNYNYRHSQARIAVERCIGLLKGRMRSLLHCLPMSRIDLMPQYIIACCVLHNICMQRGDEIDIIAIGHNERENRAFADRIEKGAIDKRTRIMHSLPQ